MLISSYIKNRFIQTILIHLLEEKLMIHSHSAKQVEKNTIILILLIFVSFFIISNSSKGSIPSYNIENTIDSVESVEITVLIDNNPSGSYKAPWGVSMLVETPYNKILFDCGPDKDDLKNNAEAMGVTIDDIDFIIISHEHLDHVDGLDHYDNNTNSQIESNLKVYVPAGMSQGTKASMELLGLVPVEVSSTTDLGNGLYVIGQLAGPPYEHALAVNVTGVGLVILVGCSHPSVDNIVAKATEELNTTPYVVLGGFHEGSSDEQEVSRLTDSLLNFSLSQIYPFHCSGDLIRNYLHTTYPKLYSEVCVGTKLLFSEESISSTTKVTASNVSGLFCLIPIILIVRKSKEK
jgi:7,8-dihydropterin-6-yl-methyl-4-(beta-D-ribofuranosyl)aminobenzene 5'-phosphate synthase